MKIYNTMTNRLEEFIPVEKGKVKLYVCGPTVYNYIHIGNARPVVVFDTLARFFKYMNYKVEYVQNFTDVDDKIIKRANEEGISTEKVTEKYIKGFFEDIEPLNPLKDIIRPRVTENMAEIIDIIKRLIENGYAYAKDGNVFFDVKKYKDYGKLSNQKIDELELGARVDIMEEKNDPLDFALWKNKKEGEPYWESPWGQGRPGWHIECSAMSRKYLGETFDIHGGGQDLIFPHHENEIAQSRCAYHGEFAKYWMHNGFIQVDGDKMSKSLGNFFLLREILEKFSGNVIRLFILSTHYRKPVNFSFQNMEDSRRTLQNIVSSMKRFSELIERSEKNKENAGIGTDKVNIAEFQNKVKELDKKFIFAMEEDMNTPQALSAIFDQIRETNKFYDNICDKLSSKNIQELKISYEDLKEKIENALGIILLEENGKENNHMAEKLIELLLKLRNDARKEKNFKLSDEIRDSLKELGIEIKDNKDGTSEYTI